MKVRNLILGLSVLAVMAVACNSVPGAGSVELKNETDSVSYALGYLVASGMKKSLKPQFDTIYGKSLAKGFAKSELSDAMKKKYEKQFDTVDYKIFKTAFANEMGYGRSYIEKNKASIYLRTVSKRMLNRRAMQPGMPAYKNKMKGDAFLAENGKRAGVITTQSGLQYEVIKEGEGEKPSSKDKVEVWYKETLLDGTVFDSSYKRDKPSLLHLNRVIKGWLEGLQLMSVGAKYKFYIPAKLAYGIKGKRKKVAPMEMLIFEVELVNVIKKEEKKEVKAKK